MLNIDDELVKGIDIIHLCNDRIDDGYHPDGLLLDIDYGGDKYGVIILDGTTWVQIVVYHANNVKTYVGLRYLVFNDLVGKWGVFLTSREGRTNTTFCPIETYDWNVKYDDPYYGMPEEPSRGALVVYGRDYVSD